MTSGIRYYNSYKNAVYFIVDGILVGSFENGDWQSLVDPKADSDDPGRYFEYLIKDILACGYTTYERDREIGYASEVFLFTGDGLGV